MRNSSSTPTSPRPGATLLVRELVAAALGLAVAVTALTILATVARRGTAGSAGAARPDEVLLVLLAWLGVLLAVWLGLGSLLALAALLPGAAGRAAAEVAARVTPLAVRKALTFALGASVGSLALPPAPVSGAGSGPVARGVDAGLSPGYAPTPAHLPTPGYLPTPDRVPPSSRSTPSTALPLAVGVTDRPDASRTPGAGRPPTGPGYVPTAPPPVHDADRSRLMAPPPRHTTAVHDLVTVRRGDSLWTIAARHLGAGASDAEVAGEWPRWYAANREVIGDDPDLLLPGVQLTPPAVDAEAIVLTRCSPASATDDGSATSATPAPQGARR